MRKSKVCLVISLVLAFANVSIFAQTKPVDRTTQKVDKIPIEVQQEGKGIRACCPRLWEEKFGKYFRVHQLPGKNVTDTYGVEFLPDTAMDNEMKAYAPYAGTYAPTGWTANSVLLVAEMRQVATSLGSTPTSNDFNNASAATEVVWTNNSLTRREHALRGWYTSSGSGIWNGPFANLPAGGCATVPWEQMYMDGICSKPPHMQPNKWYVIRLKLQLASMKNGVPDSWRQDDISCSNYKYVAIAVQSASFKSAPNTSATKAGKIVEIQ
jgi:hypothetical protein